jgi:hypothetical protein
MYTFKFLKYETIINCFEFQKKKKITIIYKWYKLYLFTSYYVEYITLYITKLKQYC